MWAEQLAELVIEQRFGGFIVMGDDPDVLRRFAGEVVPAVRELVAAEHPEPRQPRADLAGTGPVRRARPVRRRGRSDRRGRPDRPGQPDGPAGSPGRPTGPARRPGRFARPDRPGQP